MRVYQFRHVGIFHAAEANIVLAMSLVLKSTGYGFDHLKLIQYQGLLFFARSTFAAFACKSFYCHCFSFASQCCRCERAEIIAEGLQKSKTPWHDDCHARLARLVSLR
jgi:hypothetical protein